MKFWEEKPIFVLLLTQLFLGTFISARILDNHIKNGQTRIHVFDFEEHDEYNSKNPNTSNQKNETLQETKIDNCSLSSKLIQEIQSYGAIADLILKTVLNGTFKGRTYKDLAFFVDKFGSRQAGTANLEHSIDFIMEKMRNDGVENVHGEEADIPHWVRYAY